MLNAHRIDEFVFECSFSMASFAKTDEPEISGWLTAELLPAIDEILTAFDETGTVWRLDQVEIDLGDIPADNFYAELLKRMREKLRERLFMVQKKYRSAEPVSIDMPVLHRFSEAQSDLEVLHDFLLTGMMPWHADAESLAAHEHVLHRLLHAQAAPENVAILLKRVPPADRSLMIRRLVSQFSQPHLYRIVSVLSPVTASKLFEFMTEFRKISESGKRSAAWNTKLWEAVFEILLSDDSADEDFTALIDRVVETMSAQYGQESILPLREIARQYRKTNKTGGASNDTLAILDSSSSKQSRAIGHDRVWEAANIEAGQKSAATVQPQPAEDALYDRVIVALRKAKLIAANFSAVLSALKPAERKQRLRIMLQSAAALVQLPELPQHIQSAIHYLLDQRAALLLERLLAHSDILSRLPETGARETQTNWQKRAWTAGLVYLLAETEGEFEAGAYLQALACGMSGGRDARIVLSAWQRALEAHNVVDSISALLYEHTHESDTGGADTTGKDQNDGLSGEAQSKLKTLIDRLHRKKQTIAFPGLIDELRQRFTRTRVSQVQLSSGELQSLVEMLVMAELPLDRADRRVFLQAIAQKAVQVSDQHNYYRQLLENMLLDREIDLEAMDVLAQPVAQVSVEANSRSAAQSPVACQARYVRIINALRSAGLIDERTAIDMAEAAPPAELKRRLRAIVRHMESSDWIGRLTQSAAMDTIWFLSPQAALLIDHLLSYADALRSATNNVNRDTPQQWLQRLWTAVFNCLLICEDREPEPVVLLQAIARGISGNAHSSLQAWYAMLAQNNVRGVLPMLLQACMPGLSASVPVHKDAFSSSTPNRSETAQSDIDWDVLLSKTRAAEGQEEIYIENAGQVLAAPYLPRLFTLLNLIEEGAFIDRQAAERAVHLLQFMVNEQTQSPEYQLTLNKILCGITTGIPICGEIEVSAHEREIIEGLIQGMIQNWKAIGKTSISGIRETFLQRKGRLQLKDDGMWYLTVEPGVFDMLLDSLPWSFSVIKHTWMDRPVHVSWR